MHPWEWPTEPWSRVHADYGGPVMGQMLLVLIDAHSKWIEVYMASTVMSNTTIHHVRDSFSRFRIPRTVVTDNGPAFASAEFSKFM